MGKLPSNQKDENLKDVGCSRIVLLSVCLILTQAHGPCEVTGCNLTAWLTTLPQGIPCFVESSINQGITEIQHNKIGRYYSRESRYKVPAYH